MTETILCMRIQPRACPKSPAAVTLVIVRLLLPVLVRVTVEGSLVVPTTWLPKVRFANERHTPGAFSVPLNAMTLVPVLSARVTAPLRVPAAAGVKVTLMVQVPAGASGLTLTQFPAAAKSPLSVTPLMVGLSVPVLVIRPDQLNLVLHFALRFHHNHAGTDSFR